MIRDMRVFFLYVSRVLNMLEHTESAQFTSLQETGMALWVDAVPAQCQDVASALEAAEAAP